MKKALTRKANLIGNVSGLTGDVSSLTGDASGLTGDVTGLRGNVSGLRGRIDLCELTAEDRATGINVKDLIA